jgi:hypothetical protein
MRHRVCLALALVLSLAPGLAAEPAATPEAPLLALTPSDVAPAVQTCASPQDAIEVGEGLILVNVEPGTPAPFWAQVSICNCTVAGTCGSCSPPPCILCPHGQTCRNRPCLTTVGSCKNGVCG